MPCQQGGNGKGARCRFHGGMSTGPRTSKGKRRISAAQRQRWRAWRVTHRHGVLQSRS
jgi:hypothetical protein